MTTIIRKTMVYISILGLIGIVALVIFGDQATFVTRESLGNGLYWYKYDIHAYLVNIGQTLQIDFNSLIPTQPTVPDFSIDDVLSIGITAIVKALFLVVNWVVYIIGLTVLLPIKMIMYIITVIVSLMGINMNGLTNVTTTIYRFNIPYLQYSWIN